MLWTFIPYWRPRWQWIRDGCENVLFDNSILDNGNTCRTWQSAEQGILPVSAVWSSQLWPGPQQHSTMRICSAEETCWWWLGSVFTVLVENMLLCPRLFLNPCGSVCLYSSKVTGTKSVLMLCRRWEWPPTRRCVCVWSVKSLKYDHVTTVQPAQGATFIDGGWSSEVQLRGENWESRVKPLHTEITQHKVVNLLQHCCIFKRIWL